MNNDVNKEIVWDGEDRTIPGYGEVKKGVTKSLPKDLADLFVRQKEAHSKRGSTKKTTGTSKEGV